MMIMFCRFNSELWCNFLKRGMFDIKIAIVFVRQWKRTEKNVVFGQTAHLLQHIQIVVANKPKCSQFVNTEKNTAVFSFTVTRYCLST